MSTTAPARSPRPHTSQDEQIQRRLQETGDVERDLAAVGLLTREVLRIRHGQGKYDATGGAPTEQDLDRAYVAAALIHLKREMVASVEARVGPLLEEAVAEAARAIAARAVHEAACEFARMTAQAVPATGSAATPSDGGGNRRRNEPALPPERRRRRMTRPPLITGPQRQRLWAIAREEGGYTEPGLRRLLGQYDVEDETGAAVPLSSTKDIGRDVYDELCARARSKHEATRFNADPAQEELFGRPTHNDRG